jgi:pyruvate dehydrogenase E1 component beta subunit
MHFPGLRVVAPTTPFDAKGCLIQSIRDDNPVIFVEHRLLYGTKTHVPADPFAIEIGRARICSRGDDSTIVGISNMVVEALHARDLVREVGINPEVIDPVSLIPLDIDTIFESALRTRRLLVIDNGWTACGAGAEIITQVIERAGSVAGIQMRRLGFAPTACPTTPALERLFYPNPSTIASAINEMVGGPGGWSPDPDRVNLGQKEQFRGPF